MDEDEIKVGARNSRADITRLQAAHDALVEAGAVCARKSLEPAETVIYDGNEVKALGDGKIGGYLVRFSSADDPDLTGDYFAKSTNFGDHTTTPVLYQHGMDTKMGRNVIGEGTLKADDVGVWIDAQLNMRDEYEKAIYALAEKGKLGWSSGTAAHLVTREAVGKAHLIKTWPLGLDASLTPTPAEPRNQARTIKTLTLTTEAASADAGQAAATAPVVEANPTFEKALETANMTDIDPKAVEAKAVDIDAIVKEAAKAAVEAYAKSLPAGVTAGANVTVVTDAADQPFKSVGEYFMAVKNAAMSPMNEDIRLRPLKATGMSEGQPADGGYLVPKQTAGGIQQNMFSTGAILSRVAMDSISGNNMTYNQVDETSRASTLFGGVTAYWASEGGTLSSSGPKFKQLELKLKKVTALAYATDELLSDVSAMQGWITRNVPDALRFATEAAFFYADGVGKPLGIVGAPGTVSVTRVDASKVSAADIVAMYARRLGNGPFAWLINRDVTPQLFTLGSTYQSYFITPGQWQSAPGGALLGFPVLEVEYASTLGTVGDIVLADLSKYQAIQSGGIETATSIHVKFTTGEQAFRFTYRVDGAPMLSSVITPHKGSNTLSPFVTLSTSS